MPNQGHAVGYAGDRFGANPQVDQKYLQHTGGHGVPGMR